jgi:hypothetical protein
MSWLFAALAVFAFFPLGRSRPQQASRRARCAMDERSAPTITLGDGAARFASVDFVSFRKSRRLHADIGFVILD